VKQRAESFKLFFHAAFSDPYLLGSTTTRGKDVWVICENSLVDAVDLCGFPETGMAINTAITA
jgi:hypothetical protein